MNLEYPQQVLEKFSKIKFHENPFSWSRNAEADDPGADWRKYGQTDWHDEVNSSFINNICHNLTSSDVNSICEWARLRTDMGDSEGAFYILQWILRKLLAISGSYILHLWNAWEKMLGQYISYS